VNSVPHGVSLFNALVASATAFGSAVLLSVRTQYRAAVDRRFGERLLLWSRETWENQTVFTVVVVGVGLLPVALVLFASSYLR
jgi:hypothetical protein